MIRNKIFCLPTSYDIIKLCIWRHNSFSRKIHNFIFSKSVDNFFYTCFFFVAPLSAVIFSSCWFWDTIQSQPTYRCTMSWSPNPLNILLKFFTIFCYRKAMFSDFRSAINATSVRFKRPFFFRNNTKKQTQQQYRSRQLHHVFSAPNHNSSSRAVSFKYCFKSIKQNSNYSRIFGWYWQVIIWSTNCWIFFRIFVISTHSDISEFLYFCQSLLSSKLTLLKTIYMIFFKFLSKFVRVFFKHYSILISELHVEYFLLTFSRNSCDFS